MLQTPFAISSASSSQSNSIYCLYQDKGGSVQRPQCSKSTLLGTEANRIHSEVQIPFGFIHASALPDVGKEYISFLQATNKKHNWSEVLREFNTSYIKLSKLLSNVMDYICHSK